MERKENGPKPPNPALPYREDCWSEGATSTLIDAWGDRFVELNRGNLRQKQWQEVADAVNSRQTVVSRPTRTDVQCKNRIDTLKKKYKAEKVKIVESKGMVSSQWQFFSRLDTLIGQQVESSVSKKLRLSSPSLPVALPLPHKKHRLLRPPVTVASQSKRPNLDGSFLKKGSYSAVVAAAAAAKDEGSESESELERSSTERRGGWRERVKEINSWKKGTDFGNDDGVKELAKAIKKFGEIYEKVECAKQKQMIELERQRIEFMKGLEFQRMEMFIDSHVQIQKIKHARKAPATSADCSYL